jgi:deoxyadenosine/deoxycytidine kinase
MTICVEGNIGAGKSTVLCALAKARPDLRLVPEPLHVWGTMLEAYYEDPGSWSLPLHLRILYEFWKCEPGCNVVIERSPGACRHVFGQLSYNDDHLTPTGWNTFKSYHDALGWEPDAYVYVDTPIEVCAARIKARGRPCEQRISEEYLRRIDFQYHNFLKFSTVPVVRVDGTLPPDEIVASIMRSAWPA